MKNNALIRCLATMFSLFSMVVFLALVWPIQFVSEMHPKNSARVVASGYTAARTLLEHDIKITDM